MSSFNAPRPLPSPIGGARPTTPARPPASSTKAPPSIRSAQAALLVPSGLLIAGGHVDRAADPSSSASVLRQALAGGIRQVWIGRAMAAELGFPERFEVPDDRRDDFYRFGYPSAWLEPALLEGWTAATAPPGLNPWGAFAMAGRWVDVVLPAWDPDRNPFAAARTAGELLGALDLFAQAVGVRYRRSPATTGLALMREVHSGSGAVPLPEGTPAPPALEPSDSDAPGSWIRPLPRNGWLHAWDVNGQYLAACSAAELGFGPPEHIVPPAPLRVEASGYYRAKVKTPARTIPPPFLFDGRARWYVGEALHLAQEIPGSSIDVLEAWVYPESRRWLEPWYRRLRDARAALTVPDDPPAMLALGALKAVYTASLGRLAGSWLEVGDPTFRPDWRDVVVARARANFYRHLRRVAGGPPRGGFARTPIAVGRTDVVVYASAREDPADAAAELGLEVSGQLGKFKALGSLEAGAGRRAVAPHRGDPPRAVTALLDALGGHR